MCFFPFDAFLCLALSLSIHILQTFFNCSQNTRKKTHTHTYEYQKSANCVAVRVPHSFVPSLYVCVCIRRAFQCVRNKRDANFSCVNYFSCYYRPFFYHNFIVIYDRMECLYCVCVFAYVSVITDSLNVCLRMYIAVVRCAHTEFHCYKATYTHSRTHISIR